MSFLRRECERSEEDAAEILDDNETLGRVFREDVDVHALYFDTADR